MKPSATVCLRNKQTVSACYCTYLLVKDGTLLYFYLLYLFLESLPVQEATTLPLFYH